MNTVKVEMPAHEAVEAAKKVLADAAEALAQAEQANREKIEDERRSQYRSKQLEDDTIKHEKRLVHFREVFKHIDKALPNKGLSLQAIAPEIKMVEYDSVPKPVNHAGTIRIVQGENEFAFAFGSLSLHMETAYSRGYSYRATPVGTKFVIGSYGDKVHYPMKKDGTYSYAKIAAEWVSRYEAKIAQMKREAVAADNQAASEAAVTALALPEGVVAKYGYGPVLVKPSSAQAGYAYVEVKFAKHLPADKAEQFASAMLALLETFKEKQS